MQNIKRIFLVGLMGAGKTTIGRQLAKALELDFVDSDHEIENRTGVDIPLIFELEGETGFRKREAAVIEELTQRPNIVLATGGGAVLSETNREYLKNRGTVIYLKASIDQILQRTHRDTKRPLLQTEDPRQKLEQLLELRGALYEEVADLIITTDKQKVKNVVEHICHKLEKRGISTHSH